MNLLFNFDHPVSTTPLLIDVCLTNNNRILFKDTLNLNKPNYHLSILFDIAKIEPQKLKLSFLNNDHNIINHPLIITNILLDNFYSLDKILYSGHSKFDNNFLTYAKQNQIVLEENICDTNQINFTGELTYYFEWPFYKNIFTNFRSLRIRPTKTQ
jgi:hypothetical protein